MTDGNHELSSIQFNTIVNQIERQRCVPFLGAAANVSNPALNYQGLPIGATLASVMFEELEYRKRKLEKMNKMLEELGVAPERVQQFLASPARSEDSQGLSPQEMLERYLSSLGLSYSSEQNLPRLSEEYESQTGRPELHRFLKREIPDEERQPSPLLDTLARLPLKLIVTTNYDRLMEKALENAGKEPGKDFRVVVQELDLKKLPFFHQRVSELIDGYSGLILYKIHGSFPPGQAAAPVDDLDEKLLITEDDYVEMLTFITHKDTGIPNKIKAILTTSTVLFFGYSLEDWDFRVLYKSLIESLSENRREKAFAFQRRPDPAWVDFWGKKDLNIIDIDHYVLAGQIKDACRTRGFLKE